MRLAVLENLSDGVYFVDRQRRILYWNRGAERISGFAAAEVVGRHCKDNILNHCDEAGTVLCGSSCPLLDTVRDGEQREVHVYLRHKDGHRKAVRIRSSPIRDAEGVVIGAAETFYDDAALARSRQHAEELQSASLSDPLTGVGNRRHGDAMLREWAEQHRVLGRSFGVLFVDIDSFKEVNDRFGHDVGDEALRVVASTLADVSRRDDQVMRWGGEEFLVLLAGADAATLRAVAERMRALVKRTRLIADRRLVPLSVSIGGTLVAQGDTVDSILRRADALLYESKASGRNSVSLDFER